jgi:hypothetical protein
VWNVYAIGDSHHLASDTAEMYVAREIEVRPGVIMANRRMAGTFDDFFEWGDDVNDDMAKTFGLGGDDDDDDESLESALEKLRDKPWNPDDNPGPDDPRIKGAGRRTAGWGDWENIRKPGDEPPPSMENHRSHEDDEAEELARKRHDLGSYYPGKFMHADKGGCTCWEGYERVPGTEPCANGSCRKKTGAALFARLAGEGMSYEDTMKHIDDVLAEGEGHDLHHVPRVETGWRPHATPSGTPGEHKLSIERHLIDEDYLEEQLDSGTHLLDPEMSHEYHPSEQDALDRMRDVSDDHGTEVVEYHDHAAPEPGVRYFRFEGPEEDECQGYAELRPNADGQRPGRTALTETRRLADWTKYDDDVDPVVEAYGKSKIPSTKAPRIPRDWSRREPDGKWKNTNFAPKKK